ncbi:MAG: HEAT repeat domain-containing protein, partial [bacterium]|nr:HEAT repeat domain-containing protein [bacterium]
ENDAFPFPWSEKSRIGLFATLSNLRYEIYSPMRLTIKLILILLAITLSLPFPAGAADPNGEPLPYPESLLEDLKSKDDSTRLSAIQAIKPFRETRSLPLLLAIVMEDPNRQVRLQAVGALWNRGDSKAAKILEKVLVLDKDEDVRLASAGALGDVGIKSTSSIFLVNTVQSSKDYALIARCLRSLGKLGDHSSTNTVSGFLSQQYPSEVRGTAAEALGLMGAENKVGALIDTLEKDPDNTVRSIAAQALGRIASGNATEPLVRILLFDSSDIVRYQSAEALGQLRMTSSIYDAFIEGLKDPDKRVRYTCLVYVSGRLKKEDTGAVAELLSDERKGIRELSHQTLSRRGIVMERIGDRYRLVE